MNCGSFVQRIPTRSTNRGPLRHPSTQMGLKYVTWKQTNQTPKAAYGVILFTRHSGKEKMTGKIGTGFDDTRHHQELFLVGGWAALPHLGYGDDHVTLYIRQNVQNHAQKVNFTIYKWKTALKIHNQIYPWPKAIQEKNSDFPCDIILDFLFKYDLPQFSFMWFLREKGSIHFERFLQEK